MSMWESFWEDDANEERRRAETDRELARQEEQIRHEAEVRARRWATGF